MKVMNWKRAVAATLAAAGCWAPAFVQAGNLPLSDPSFEAYALSSGGYAYANSYRPTSGWIGNPDGSGPLDGGPNGSNWIYDSVYAEGSTLRGAPRTGNQAMHGRGHYSAQESSAVFEAGKTYTFSIYAQGDHNSAIIGDNVNGPGWDSRVWLYIYDGSKPFTEAGSLTYDRYSPAGDRFNQNDFVNRTPGSTAAESRAAWQQISISWTVQPGAAEIGQPIGVAFWSASDNCLDDASLSATPEPSTAILAGLAGVSLLGTRRKRS